MFLILLSTSFRGRKVKTMNVLWNDVLYSASSNIWEPDYRGFFFVGDLFHYYFYRAHSCIACAKMDNHGIVDASILFPDIQVNLPRFWCLVGEKDDHLMCAPDICVDLNTLSICKNIPLEYKKMYEKRVSQWGHHLVYDHFVFGDYIVSHLGECNYICSKNGETLWKLKGQGYLHTEIIQYNENIMFGTDGNGGHFYIVSLATGSVICNINTHGTNQYVHNNGINYLLICGKPSKVVAVSAETGKTIEIVDLPGQADPNSRITLKDNRLYVVTFQYKGRIPQRATITCIETSSMGTQTNY